MKAILNKTFLILITNIASVCLTKWIMDWSFTPSFGHGAGRILQQKDTCCSCRRRICNGLASNCNRRANEIMYASVHNAMSSKEDNFGFAGIGFNNLLSMEKAMAAGFRGFLVDSCLCPDLGGVKFCHGLCTLGTRNPGDVLPAMVRFLRNHPNDIMVLEWQITDDTLSGLWSKTGSGFRNLLYRHPGRGTPWPTLNELIDAGKRIILFQHDGADCDVAGSCPAGVLDTYDYMFETPFELVGSSELLDYTKSCQVKRGNVNADFMLSNHFASQELNVFGTSIRIANQGIAEIVNTEQVLQSRMDACEGILGRRPNLLVVDFWSIGDVVAVVQRNNLALATSSSTTSTRLSTPPRNSLRNNIFNMFKKSNSSLSSP